MNTHDLFSGRRHICTSGCVRDDLDPQRRPCPYRREREREGVLWLEQLIWLQGEAATA